DLLLRDEGTHARRQVLDADQAVLREDHEPLEEILELAHVARPVVLPEVDHCLLGDAGGAARALAVVLLEEVAGEKRDVRRPIAPVNAPRSWPNISDSRSSAGIAPQLTGMKGRSTRGLSAWTARAISSLPVPLSPMMRMVASVVATLRTSWVIF